MSLQLFTAHALHGCSRRTRMTITQRTQVGMTTTANAGLGGSRPDQLVAAGFDRAGMSVTYDEIVLDALVTVLVQGRGGGQRRCCRSRLTAVVDCVGGTCVRFLNKGKRGRRTGVSLHCTLRGKDVAGGLG